MYVEYDTWTDECSLYNAAMHKYSTAGPGLVLRGQGRVKIKTKFWWRICSALCSSVVHYVSNLVYNVLC